MRLPAGTLSITVERAVFFTSSALIKSYVPPKLLIVCSTIGLTNTNTVVVSGIPLAICNLLAPCTALIVPIEKYPDLIDVTAKK
jgi:hypothetical protein